MRSSRSLLSPCPLVLLPLFLLPLVGTGCAHTTPSPSAPSVVDTLAHLDARMPEVLRKHVVAGVGIAVIRDGEVMGTRTYGDQAAGRPVTPATIFNTASVAKTVTAETLLALAAEGSISLDEPIHGRVSHPDLANDPRFELLTPRLLMSHRSGLLNWPHNYDDGKLAFVRDPGTGFGYSGMGVRLAALYAEEVLGRDFEDLAFEQVLGPLGIERDDMALGRLRPAFEGRLAVPMDSEGNYGPVAEMTPRLDYPFAEGPERPWSAADDLLTTVDAYARFLAAVPASPWLSEPWETERSELLTPLNEDPVWRCEAVSDFRCPTSYGHGVGWMVYRYDDHTVLQHTGGDAGEAALAYISPETGDGAVILVNGGNGAWVMVAAAELLGDEPDLAAYFRQVLERVSGDS